ncbi:unnamed protein product [Durusdinium trenchii]|uniref:BTB domain-containing protein n=1 Tax=Durusdinium trenchii TaxID=1381693 RepID=A0ABP0P8N0_9DINO
MFSFREALAEDEFPAVCPAGENDIDPSDDWDLDFSFQDENIRPEIRLYAGARPDVTLFCNGGTLLAHRRILAEVNYFASLFQGSFAEHGTDRLTVEEDLEVFLEVIRWIYCRSATNDKEKALDLLRLAEFYGIDGLIDHAARVLAAPSFGFCEGEELSQRCPEFGHSSEEERPEEYTLAATAKEYEQAEG